MSREFLSQWRQVELPPELRQQHRHVLLEMGYRAWDDGSYTFGNEVLRKACGYKYEKSVRMAQRHLQRLGFLELLSSESPGRNQKWRVTLEPVLERDGRTLVLPSEEPRQDREPVTVGRRAGDGRTETPSRQDVEPTYQRSNVTNAANAPGDLEQALSTIRRAMPGEYQRSFTTPPKLKQLLTAVLERGYTVEALELEFKAYPWQTKSPDRVGFAVQDKLEALANAEPPRVIPAHKRPCLYGCNSSFHIEDPETGKPLRQCPARALELEQA